MVTDDQEATRELDGENHSVRRFVVRGRVQGVGFRWWTRREAQALELTGTVCNRADGSVEVVARGSARALRDLEARLQEGPVAARVDSVDAETPSERSAAVADLRSFEIVRG